LHHTSLLIVLNFILLIILHYFKIFNRRPAARGSGLSLRSEEADISENKKGKWQAFWVEDIMYKQGAAMSGFTVPSQAQSSGQPPKRKTEVV
jgi:hypothetical protein